MFQDEIAHMNMPEKVREDGFYTYSFLNGIPLMLVWVLSIGSYLFA